MKLNKHQLKLIIKEELSAFIKEGGLDEIGDDMANKSSGTRGKEPPHLHDAALDLYKALRLFVDSDPYEDQTENRRVAEAAIIKALGYDPFA